MPAMKSFSIAQARNGFAELVHAVEQGENAEITRRHQAVAVLISYAEYQRLLSAAANASDFSSWAQKWREAQSGGFDGLSHDEISRWLEA